MTKFNIDKESFLNTWQRLCQKWQETSLKWDDIESRRFERDFMIPLETEMSRTIREMDRLGNVITFIDRKEKN
jgi:hypothetical protein